MSEHTARLREFLMQQPEGPLSELAAKTAVRLLGDCWDALEGTSDTSMRAEKLYRAEEMTWDPPTLTFLIERHGGTVLGSISAEVHRWEIDVEQGIARWHHETRRQVRAASPPLDVEPIADQIAECVSHGSDHPALKWSEDRRRVRLLIAQVIPGEGPKQTMEGRRKRLRLALQERLPGWNETSANVWERGEGTDHPVAV